MKKFTLDNGWVVMKDENGGAILHVIPLPNSIFRKEQFVEIPDHIFIEIESGETRVKELFQKFKLHDLIFQWEKREPVKLSIPQNSENLFYGNDFLVSDENGIYYLIYEYSGHGGGAKKNTNQSEYL